MMSKLKSLPAKALHHPCDSESMKPPRSKLRGMSPLGFNLVVDKRLIEFREALKLKKDDQDENDER